MVGFWVMIRNCKFLIFWGPLPVFKKNGDRSREIFMQVDLLLRLEELIWNLK